MHASVCGVIGEIPLWMLLVSEPAPLNRGGGQCLAGSLTGAVASQRVTEAPKGSLSLVGNQVASVRAQGSLTVRPTGRADAKAGPSDPAPPYGRGVAQRLKGTPGITG
jgi:hypothetical protein